MAMGNWDNLSINENLESCRGSYTSPMGIIVKAYKNWLHVKDKYAHRENPYVMTSPVIMKITTGDIHYMDIDIVCEFQSDFDDSSNDPENWHSNYNRILYCIWNSYDDEPDFTGICGVACFADMKQNDIDALTKFLNNGDEYYSKIPKRFRNFDFSKSLRYNQGDMFFHDTIGTESQCTLIGKEKPTIFEQMLGD